MIIGNETTKYLIYKHTCLKTNKSYIGQTKDIVSRTKSHVRPSSGCIAFRNAIQKHGWDTFIHEILAEGLTLDEANTLEEQLIKDCNTIAPNGYNIRSGGKNKLIHENTKQKISIKLKGRKIPQEVIQKRRAKTKGRSQKPENAIKSAIARTGLKRTKEQCKRIGQGHVGFKHSDITKQKMSQVRTGLIYKKSTCPHCGKIGGGGAMKQWHFNNCQFKKDIA